MGRLESIEEERGRRIIRFGGGVNLLSAMVVPDLARMDSPLKGMASISSLSMGIGSPGLDLPSQGENSTNSLLVNFFPNLFISMFIQDIGLVSLV